MTGGRGSGGMGATSPLLEHGASEMSLIQESGCEWERVNTGGSTVGTRILTTSVE